MRKYLKVTQLAVLDLFQYRFDFIVHTSKYALMVMMMALVWIAVQKESQSLSMNLPETVTYFVLAAMLYSLSNFHTTYIEEDIKLGLYSKYLLKPISAFKYYFSFEFGFALFETLAKSLVMIPLLMYMGWLVPLPVGNLLLALLFLPVIFIFAFNQFSLISGLSFWITESYAIRWSLTIIFRFLAGFFVPISFFPPITQRVFFWLPFQHLLYTPVQLISGKLPLSTAAMSFMVLGGWTLVLVWLRLFVWRKGELRYDSTGA